MSRGHSLKQPTPTHQHQALHRSSSRKVPAPRRPASVQSHGFPFDFYAAFCFVGVLLGATLVERLSWLLWLAYAVMNLLTFALYRYDKNAAIAHQQRVPEQSLHVMSLFGGWPAAAVAQQLYRHKTQKQPFKTLYYVTAVAHSLAALGILYLAA